MASGVPQWSKALHCSTSCSTIDSVFKSRLCSSRPGDPWGGRTIGTASSGLGEGLASRDVLVSSHTSDSCGEPGAVHADMVLWHIGVSRFRVKLALCQEAVRLGWVVFRRMHSSRPSPLLSLYRSCSDKTNYQLGSKKTRFNFFIKHLHYSNI